MSNPIEPTDAPYVAEPVTAPPVTSRFLFVDIAAQRAKQLRRGARPRLADGVERSHKLERVAMREVHDHLIDYTIVPVKQVTVPDAPPAQE